LKIALRIQSVVPDKSRYAGSSWPEFVSA
jgi:hypothetical protein